jgi:glucose-1-phosphate adenylyltransferase
MNDVLTLILGGGRGTRLFPLTHMRSKPAVPIGGKHRLIDIPISNCLHAGLKRIFVLTQFNSASLNRHVAQTYRLDMFSDGFVEVLAAEQTPDSSDWFQGTADAVRQAARHFAGYDADYYLILAGDHLYRMDFCELIDAHIESSADITIAAQPVTRADATQMGIFRFDPAGRINGFEEKPNAARLAELRSSAPPGAIGGLTTDKPFVASMGIYVFSRDVLLETLERPGIDFGKEIIPAALGSLNVNAFLYRGYWADVGTIDAFYDANIQLTQRGSPFNFFHASRPIYTHQRFLPATRTFDSHIDASIVSEGCYLEHCDIRDSVVGIRTHVRRGARIARSVLLGADVYQDEDARTDDVPLGIGENVVLDRVIVDKNARIADGVKLVVESGAADRDGDGWFVRDGIIVVPKGAVVTKGCC